MDAVDDISSFIEILEEIPTALSRQPLNAAYEGGLLYVCLRNIGMAASTVLNGIPDFSRYSALHLRGIEPCPVAAQEFDSAMLSRMASQRGLLPPETVDANWVLDVHARLMPWLNGLARSCER